MSKNNDGPNWAPDADDQPKYNLYAPYSEEVNNETILQIGHHKGKRLIDVPADWLILYYQAPTSVKNYWLMQYIKLNWHIINNWN